MHAIVSHRPSRLSCIFGFGAALVLAGSAITAPAPARASGVEHLEIGALGGQQPPTAGVPFGVWVEARTPSGEIDWCYNHKVHFSYTDAATTAPADYTFTAIVPPTCDWGDNGEHWFAIVPITGGQQTITVSDVGDPAVTPGTLTFEVAPGPAASLMISGLPANSVQGAKTLIHVTAEDMWGNVATGYTGTVGFTSSDSDAVLPDPDIFNAGDGGIRPFLVTFASTGLQSLTVTDAGNANLHGSASTTVGTAPHFDIQCYDQIAGQASSCSVTARTAGGAIDTVYAGTIHFASSDQYASLDADYTFQKGQRGEAFGFAPTFRTAGVQTLTATDKKNSAIFGTGSLNVSGGDTVGVSIVGLPSSMVAGPVVVTVKTRDAYRNWGSGGTVHFTSSDAKAVLPADFTFHSLDYGTHQVTVTLESPGTVTLTVSGSNWLGSFSASASTVVSPGAATHLSVGTFNPFPAGSSHSVTIKALDAYGNTDPTYPGTIHFTSSDSKATLPADYSFTAADMGVHTFPNTLSPGLTLQTAGSQWVRATDKTTASITGSQTVTVTPGSATHFSVGTVNPFPAGSSHSVTIKALDAYGNLATGYTGSIHFTTSDSKASVPADYTFLVSDAGVHAFSTTITPNLTLKTAGSQWVRATDKTTATITGSQTVTVTPGSATHFSVGTFNPFPAGSSHSVTVKALDAYGNVATGYTGSIHFTTSDSTASVPADYTFLGSDAGVHTFSTTITPNLTLKTAGSQWVRATDKTTASITGSQTVTVT